MVTTATAVIRAKETTAKPPHNNTSKETPSSVAVTALSLRSAFGVPEKVGFTLL
jgi:hypothetical protein